MSVCAHLEDRSSHLFDAWRVFAGVQGRCPDDLQTQSSFYPSMNLFLLLLCVFTAAQPIKSVLLDEHATQCQKRSFIFSLLSP